MSAVVRTRWARRRADAGQSGIALALVLGIILLTTSVVLALLGFAFTSSRVAAGQTRDARIARAADGALEGAVATLARTGRCGAVGGSTVAFDAGSADPTDDLTVTVACGADAASDDAAAPLGGPNVEVVGEPLAVPGLVPPTPGTAGANLAVLGDVATPEAAAVTPPLFDADVTATRGAAVAAGAAAGPGMTLTGQYVQGLPGPPDPAGGACGTLSGAGGVPRSVVADRNLTPTCDDAAARATVVAPQPLLAPGDTSAPVASVPAACPPGAVVRLDPGRYGAESVRRLNALWNGSCPRTYWFAPAPPGQSSVFAFDTNDPATPALVIDDPGTSVVVGAPDGWDPATGGAPPAAFPQACDPDAPGASWQLSGRTGLRHLRGRVAICPAQVAGTALPALTQVATAPSAPETVFASSTEFVRPGGADGGPALLASPADANQFATATFTCPTFFGTCVPPPRTFTVRFANVDPAPLRSARVTWASQEAPKAQVAGTNRQVRFTLSGGVSCSTDWQQAGRSHWQLGTYELVQGGCDAALRNQPGNRLDGVTVTAAVQMTGLACSFFACGDVPEVHRVGVRGVRLVTNPSVAVPTAAPTSSSPGWGTATAPLANVNVDDAALAQAPQDPCAVLPNQPCALEAVPARRSVTVSGLRFPDGDRLSGDARVASLHVLVRNRPAGPAAERWVSDPVDDSATEIELTTSAGTCRVVHDGYSQSDAETWFDLRSAGDCAPVLPDAAALRDARVTLTMTTRCSWNGAFRLLPDASGRCATVRLPELQFVGLVATTDSVTARPPQVEVSLDPDVAAGADAAPGASGSTFHVFGRTVLPRADVVVRWRGAPPTRPVFGGYLGVGGLASVRVGAARSGTICCTPAVDALRLTATVDGAVRAEAVVRVLPLPSGAAVGTPREVSVLDWRLCGSRCAPAAAPTTAPTTTAPPPGG